MASDAMEVNAEWPGRVEEVSVSIGQVVAVADVLLTIESMKMLTDVEAPVAGKVSEIAVNAGDFVEEGTRLVVIAAE